MNSIFDGFCRIRGGLFHESFQSRETHARQKIVVPLREAIIIRKEAQDGEHARTGLRGFVQFDKCTQDADGFVQFNSLIQKQCAHHTRAHARCMAFIAGVARPPISTYLTSTLCVTTTVL